MTAFWGEVIGTMQLIIFGAGVCEGVNLKKTHSFQSGCIVVVNGWGLGVAM
ncbi:aquaporin, partial [Bacillus subtilis]|nr:aquaporin [Bacillus subtilis]